MVNTPWAGVKYDFVRPSARGPTQGCVARADERPKSRKIPTRKNLTLFFVIRGDGGGGPVIIHNEGPSPLGIRTFFYNDTLLLASDSTWCTVDGALNLTQFWNNSVHTPSGKGTGARCR